MSKVRHAVARAREAECLADEAPPGPDREMLVEIARLWRELAQSRMFEEVRRRGR